MDLYTSRTNSKEFPYVVNIQNKHILSYSMSVGFLIQVNFVVATCSIFERHVHSTVDVEEERFLDFRVTISDGSLVQDPESFKPTRPQARFIEDVHLHPNCTGSVPSRTSELFLVWRRDVAVIRLSFGFDLGPHLPVISFNRALQAKRLRKIMELSNRDRSNNMICEVVGWGRTVVLGPSPFLDAPLVLRSHDLLKSTVRVLPLEVCEVHCKQNPMLCNLTNQHQSGLLVCAERTTKEYILDVVGNVTHFPCAGTEGSPLICIDLEANNSSDIYGVLTYLPDDSCANKLPLVFSRIDEVSDFIIDLRGKAQKLGKSFTQLILAITIIHLTINYHSQ